MSRLRTPLKQARNVGSAQHGTGHWWMQRLTAVALVPLGVWFVVAVLMLLHADYLGAHAMLARPWNALLMLGFIAAVFWHAQLGLQVIIEDYVHTPWRAFALIALVKLLAVLLALACALAVLRIALGS
jgi:succinate dehydrogenase / fumarate reductase membrane anchor subunit